MSQTLVQQQFGKNAAQYLTSKSHAQGKSLERLVTLTAPQKDWRVLDVATGGGHVAYTFAPHVGRVWATDITQEMLDQVKAEAAKRGLANVRVAYAKAEALPFEDASFDLVACRIAPHHFDSIPEFLAEVHRVLKPGAAAAIVDNIVPAGPIGDYINAFERLRDPSHLRAWSMAEWRAAFAAAKLVVGHEEEIDKTLEFRTWAARYDAVTRSLLLALLTHAAPEVKAALDPQGAGDAVTLRLREGLFIAKKA
ncbi:MAG: methyltransferase domain-containing protein [Pseudolabrys sp.]